MAKILILVPNGAEFRSVQRGLKKSGVNSSAQILAIPAGGAVRDFLQNCAQDWRLVKQVFVLGLCGGLSDGIQVGQMGCYECCQLVTGLRWDCARFEQLEQLEQLERWKALTTEQVITRETEKRSLYAETLCNVVDMESAWIVDFMQQRGIFVTVLRVVSDGVSGDLPDLAQAFDRAGAIQPLALGRSFVRKPVAALRLVWGSIVALRKLEDCAAMLGDLIVGYGA